MRVFNHLFNSGKMIKITFFLVIFTSFTTAQINLEDSTAQIIAYWSPGDKYTYEANLYEFKVEGDDTTDYKISTALVDITVVDSSDTNYILKWDTYGTVMEGYDDWVVQLFDNIDTVSYMIETNELGQFLDLENWEEIRDLISGAIDRTLETKPELQKFFQEYFNMKKVFSTKEAIVDLGIEEIHFVLFFHGYEFEFDQVYRSNVLAPNHVTGKPVTIYRDSYFDSVFEDSGEVVLKCDMVADSTELNQSVKEYFAETVKKMGAPDSIANNPPVISRVEYLGNAIHYNSGWTTYSHYENLLTAGKKETWKIITFKML